MYQHNEFYGHMDPHRYSNTAENCSYRSDYEMISQSSDFYKALYSMKYVLNEVQPDRTQIKYANSDENWNMLNPVVNYPYLAKPTLQYQFSMSPSSSSRKISTATPTSHHTMIPFHNFQHMETTANNAQGNVTSTRTSKNKGLLPKSKFGKKPRILFTKEQVHKLETIFNRQRYLTATEREDVAFSVKLSSNQVKIWFQNRRYKSKRMAESL